MREFLRSITPDFILHLYKRQKKKRRANERQRLALQGKVIAENDIIDTGKKNGFLPDLFMSYKNKEAVRGKRW